MSRNEIIAKVSLSKRRQDIGTTYDLVTYSERKATKTTFKAIMAAAYGVLTQRLKVDGIPRQGFRIFMTFEDMSEAPSSAVEITRSEALQLLRRKDFKGEVIADQDMFLEARIRTK
jgi:hypothetical protein